MPPRVHKNRDGVAQKQMKTQHTRVETANWRLLRTFLNFEINLRCVKLKLEYFDFGGAREVGNGDWAFCDGDARRNG